MEENPISSIQYPPGIRFQPSDEELISYYLERKVKCLPLPANVITDIELYSYNPSDLPRKTLFGQDEWYFFTPRDRKYPNGWRPNRTAGSGYWKATGTDKTIRSSCGSRKIGVKKALVYYKGKPPSGNKMDWIMTEYRLPDASRPSRSKGSMRLDDWVLCRIRQKGNLSKNERMEEQNLCEFHESNIKNLPSGYIQDNKDLLANYLQSSEHSRILSLLVGHDPGSVTIPRTIFQSHKSTECRSEKMYNQADFCLFQSPSDSKVPMNMITYEQNDMVCQSGQMVASMGTKSYFPLTSDGNKCKLNYPPNTYINWEELDMPPLQEKFL